MTDNLKKFITVLNTILARPGMYLVSKVEDINFIILGYKFCADDDKLNDFLLEFRKYVNQEYENSSDNDWSRLIRFNSSNDLHSLELFGNVFKSFSQSYS